MNKGAPGIERPVEGMPGNQPEIYAPLVPVRHCRRSGRTLARFAALVMLLVLVSMLAGKTVVATPADATGAGPAAQAALSELSALRPVATGCGEPSCPGR